LVALLGGCGSSADTGDLGTDLGVADLAQRGDLSVALPNVPAALQIPESGDVVILRAPARGVQIYTCTAGSPADGGTADGGAAYSWVFSAPDAMLFDDQMTQIGHHYAGPTWELNDSSKVVGMVLAKAASPDSTAIPWLLLKAVSTSGTGVLTRARFIQRIDTKGGIAPTTTCDTTNAGTQARVDYSATYYFWGMP
jgi:hypothetical protein